MARHVSVPPLKGTPFGGSYTGSNLGQAAAHESLLRMNQLGAQHAAMVLEADAQAVSAAASASIDATR